MKFLYSFIILVTLVASACLPAGTVNTLIGSAFAQTKTPTSSPTPQISAEQEEIDTIEKIKDLVASKVAELKLVDKRGILGVVKRSSNSQIIVEDHKKEQRSVDIDELTKFVSGQSSFGISDIAEGDTISVIGLYNKDTKRLLARFISLSENIPIDIEGVTTARDSREFTLTVADSDGKVRTIDIETSTRTNVWEEDTLTKSGFSRVLVGERVIIMGFADLKLKDTINASRIIHFVDLPLSSDLKKYQNADDETPVSTGSAGNSR